MTAFRPFLFISLLVFFLISCSSTRVVDSWSDQSHAGGVKNVFIIGFVNQGSDRMLYESIFSARLAEEGIDSRPSHSYALRFDEVERETIFERIRSSGCDSVLLTRVVGQRTQANFTTKGRSGLYSQKVFNGRETDYSLYPYDSLRIQDKSSGVRPVPKLSPTGTSFIVLTVESLLYDPKTEKLVWSTRVETYLKSNRQVIMQNLAEETIKSLKAEGFI